VIRLTRWAIPGEAATAWPPSRRIFEWGDDRLWDQRTGRPVRLDELRAVLATDARFRVVSRYSGDDCTVDVLMHLLGPLLSRSAAVPGILALDFPARNDGTQPHARDRRACCCSDSGQHQRAQKRRRR